MCYHKMFTEFRFSQNVIQSLEEPLKSKTNPVDLLDFLGRLSVEVKQYDIQRVEKRNYAKKRLMEEYHLSRE